MLLLMQEFEEFDRQGRVVKHTSTPLLDAEEDEEPLVRRALSLYICFRFFLGLRKVVALLRGAVATAQGSLAMPYVLQDTKSSTQFSEVLYPKQRC